MFVGISKESKVVNSIQRSGGKFEYHKECTWLKSVGLLYLSVDVTTCQQIDQIRNTNQLSWAITRWAHDWNLWVRGSPRGSNLQPGLKPKLPKIAFFCSTNIKAVPPRGVPLINGMAKTIGMYLMSSWLHWKPSCAVREDMQWNPSYNLMSVFILELPSVGWKSVSCSVTF